MDPAWSPEEARPAGLVYRRHRTATGHEMPWAPLTTTAAWGGGHHLSPGHIPQSPHFSAPAPAESEHLPCLALIVAGGPCLVRQRPPQTQAAAGSSGVDDRTKWRPCERREGAAGSVPWADSGPTPAFVRTVSEEWLHTLKHSSENNQKKTSISGPDTLTR